MKNMDLLKDNDIRLPFFWHIVSENDHFLHIRNWLTGQNRVLHK